MEKSNIVLSGFMASGKSTVGALLSGRLGIPLIDTDPLIEDLAGRSISEMFARDGESRFRELEREVIARESRREGVILAVGGGAVLDQENVVALKRSGIIYLLEVTPAEVERRVGADGRRPLLPAGRGSIGMLISVREEAYREAADVAVETTGRAPDEITEEIATDFGSRRRVG